MNFDFFIGPHPLIRGPRCGGILYFRLPTFVGETSKKLRDAAQKLGTPPDGLEVFDEALKQTQFSTAVEMLKNAIPPKLLILDGRNPLTLLYKPLSVHIHDLTDEQCLQQAADIRIVLNELFDNISRALADDDALKGAVARLQGA